MGEYDFSISKIKLNHLLFERQAVFSRKKSASQSVGCLLQLLRVEQFYVRIVIC